MKTRFSKRTLSRLAKVADLNPEVRSQILQAIAKLPVVLYPFEAVNDAVEKCLADAHVEEGEDDDLGGAIATVLFQAGSSAQPPDELLQSAASTLRESTKDDRTVEVVSRFVSELLSSSDLLVASKATALYEDSERLLLETKLLVDVRPIFDPKHAATIAATTLLYKLRMTFRAPQGGDLDTMVFTLREPELKELARVVDRAIEKASVVREARPFGVVVVESNDDNR
jgi:hypothetical protein